MKVVNSLENVTIHVCHGGLTAVTHLNIRHKMFFNVLENINSSRVQL